MYYGRMRGRGLTHLNRKEKGYMRKNLTGVISLPSARVHIRVAVVVAAAVVAAALFVPLHRADAALGIEDVNGAIRAAGVPVTVARSNAFQVGVINGHYKSYSQLVGAIIYHKTKEALPKFSTTAAAVVTQCVTGDVVSFAGSNTTAGTISIEGDIKGPGGEGYVVGTKTLNIAANQYKVAIAKGVGIGLNVTACSADSFHSLYGHVTLN